MLKLLLYLVSIGISYLLFRLYFTRYKDDDNYVLGIIIMLVPLGNVVMPILLYLFRRIGDFKVKSFFGIK